MRKLDLLFWMDRRAAWLRMFGGLRDESILEIAELDAWIRRRELSVPLAVADLRDLSEADLLATHALHRALDRFPRAACVLPPAWSPAAQVLRDGLYPIHCYDRMEALEAAESVTPDDWSGDDRRRFARVPVQLPAQIWLGGSRPDPGWALDLCEGGAQIGSTLRTRFVPAEMEGREVRVGIADLVTEARVARVIPSPRLCLGLEFMDPQSVKEMVEGILGTETL